jgi:hypothetical protein
MLRNQDLKEKLVAIAAQVEGLEDRPKVRWHKLFPRVHIFFSFPILE